MTREDKLKEFFEAVHSYSQDTEGLSLHTNNFREEVEELDDELYFYLLTLSDVPTKKYSRENLVKELADVQYTLSGLALYLGVDLEEAFNRVHANNMSKLIDGKIVRAENGKILKPEGYVKPDMRGL